MTFSTASMFGAKALQAALRRFQLGISAAFLLQQVVLHTSRFPLPRKYFSSRYCLRQTALSTPLRARATSPSGATTEFSPDSRESTQPDPNPLPGMFPHRVAA